MKAVLFLLLVPFGYLYVVRRWLYATKYWEERKAEHDRWDLRDLSGGVPG